jgi:hypothetical protein
MADSTADARVGGSDSRAPRRRIATRMPSRPPGQAARLPFAVRRGWVGRITARAHAGTAAAEPTIRARYPKLMFGSPWALRPVVVRLHVPPRGAPAL